MNIKHKGKLWRHAVSSVLALSLLVPATQPALAAAESLSAADRAKEVLSLLEQNHVSAPDAKKLSDAAIKAMVESLNDPYTQYFTAEQLTEFESSIANQYVGIGVRVSEQPDGIYIAQVFEGPAQAAGIRIGDVIVGIDGQSAVGVPLNKATAKIMGEPGTEVKLQIVRDGATSELTVKRERIQVPVVIANRFQGVGYVRILSFSSDADEMTALFLDGLQAPGELKSLVVDLRDNPGGLLETAQQLARLFVKEGTLIHTKNRNNTDEPVTFSGGETQPFPVYFLVNGNSASASEVLTGALQDYKAITVIGTKTYGKGSVQEVVPLQSGGALKVTVEEYLTPKLRKVNGVGLEPDVKVEGGEVPELLTALRTAGLQSITLELKRISMSVNGLDVVDTFKVVRENGQTYVPSRVLAALLGAKVEWNEASRSVQITSADGQTSYTPADGDVLLREGTNYVSAAKAAEAFSSLEWSDNGQTLKLSTSK
ncbi:S41 family peptidase [Paenibacillus validus]|uniref:PDZ domain-containing protein n=1 Tax=Paenibacillus validus TaxID=44253 RepID=A0A7X2ZGF4_9BACL|nr:S41 family peptidase [Paenibacillus validus]MUG73865.1 PDZ domain-containing protein [Paenibacillus validus]